MSIELKLPELGENITSADVADIMVKQGDVISTDQIVMELETEKAVVELPATQAGKVSKLNCKVGDTVAVGSVLMILEEADGADAAASESREEPATEQTSESEAETKSETEPKPAPATETAAAPASAAQAEPAARSRAVATAPPAEPNHRSNGNNSQDPVPAGPATRRLARELGVDIRQVSGSGPGGRISQEDVRAFVRDITSNVLSGPVTPAGTGEGLPAAPLPDFTKFGPVNQQPLNKIALTSAAHLDYAWRTIPHVTQHDETDITDVEAARKRFNAHATDATPKITMTAIMVKAIVSVLKAYPHFNSSLDPNTGSLILKQYYNIGVAVDTENGLLVPVIHDADTKSLIDTAAELNDIASRARDRKLSMSDMQGGTFTITNLGGIGGTSFTPIVNFPEVAILGMSRSRKQLQLVDGQPAERLILPLSLSYDHRVINGADAARFMVKLTHTLADPFRLFAEC